MFDNVFRTKSLEQLQASAGGPEHALKKNLTWVDLTMFGIGAIIGAGIFSTIGTAAAGDVASGRVAAGPALIISLLLTAVACGFTALCYAELASMIPIAGSAYTYAYASLGELMAWVIGWDLVLEYAVSNVAVAISWGDYARSFLAGLGLVVPPQYAIDPRTALTVSDAWCTAHHFVRDGHAVQPPFGQALALFAQGRAHTIDGAAAFDHWDALSRAAVIGGFPITINLLAVVITAAITYLCYRGVKESARANTIMVVVKLVILLAVIAVGSRFVSPGNWHPFNPSGYRGINAGAAVIFFAFIGFDAVSTTAEECRDPGRDLPRGILGSLAVCTVVYVAVTLVVTGMVRYTDLAGRADPLAYVFERYHLTSLATVISFGAMIATAACLLVYQIGQPRIMLAMSRDGLLGPWFGRVHPRFGTPSTATLLTGVIVAVPAALMNIGEVVELCNIGTLFAFVIVCIGVLVLRVKRPEVPRRFRVPFVWPVAIGGIGFCIWLSLGLPAVTWVRFFVWLVIGLVIYGLYGARRSRLGHDAPG